MSCYMMKMMSAAQRSAAPRMQRECNAVRTVWFRNVKILFISININKQMSSSISPRMPSLLDPSLLEGLTPAQQQEALAAAAAANRAEERAEERALERAMAQRTLERKQQDQANVQQQQVIVIAAARASAAKRATTTSTGNTNAAATTTTTTTTAGTNNGAPKIAFVSKRERQRQRERERQLKLEGNGGDEVTPAAAAAAAALPATPVTSTRRPVAGTSSGNGQRTTTTTSTSRIARTNDSSAAAWTEKERRAIRQTYLGKDVGRESDAAAAAAASQQTLMGGAGKHNRNNNNRQNNNNNNNNSKKKKTLGGKKKATFRFEWDNTDDTLDQSDPLYSALAPTIKKPKTKRRRGGEEDEDDDDDEEELRRGGGRHRSSNSHRRRSVVATKPLDQMTARDWRIFRENYEIVVKGGKAPPPLRSFREANFDSQLLHAIEHTLQYTEPTPIQRQAIPIGLQRRDLIGIAETGSGKTAAFGIPLLQYILSLPSAVLQRVAEEGPLAIVVAPTRELALQIHGEFQKLLSKQRTLQTAAIVGGQSLQHQAQELRDGVHVVVGTPGRINDCIDMAYLVLNQCCYIVLDEADRMIDMGFAPQMEGILDAMGGLLKSDNEAEAYAQEAQDRMKLSSELPRHRLTAMFSATMPLEVERMAKRYLRHPAVISIGDQDSSKNTRISQRLVWVSGPHQKESALRDLILNPRFAREKIIVFVNEKKHADGIGRMVERFGRPCVVLHGGKSQDQREENLAQFRQGQGVVLVATDVAGRGLDIPNVAHVINYDLPTRSIDTYSHRIGRTGRAGKDGVATSLISDKDDGIMAPLKAYLESTGQPVPPKLARHPAANANSAHGNLIY